MYVIEATLWIRKSPDQPSKIREVVEKSEYREIRSSELSKQGYWVFSWPIDDDNKFGE